MKNIFRSVFFTVFFVLNYTFTYAQVQERGTASNRMLATYMYSETPVTEIISPVNVEVMNHDTPLRGTGFLSNLEEVSVRVSSENMVIPKYTVKAKILRRGSVIDEKVFKDQKNLSKDFFRWIKATPIKDESFNVMFLIEFEDQSIQEKTYLLRVKPF